MYFNGAQPCDTEENYAIDTGHKITWSLTREGEDYIFSTNVYDFMPAVHAPLADTELLGEAFEPEQKFEAPDGTPILFDEDYFGEKRPWAPIPGPLAAGADSSKL